MTQPAITTPAAQVLSAPAVARRRGRAWLARGARMIGGRALGLEAQHPNQDRHAVWDGWAVRKDTARPATTSFPGRDFLYRRSHLSFALRKWRHGGERYQHAGEVFTCAGAYGAPAPACVEASSRTSASCPELLACTRRDPASPR